MTTTDDELAVLRETLASLRAAQASAPAYSKAGLANQIRLTVKAIAALEANGSGRRGAGVAADAPSLSYLDALRANIGRHPVLAAAGWTPPPADTDYGAHTEQELRRVAALLGRQVLDPDDPPEPVEYGPSGEPDDDEGLWDDDDA